MRKWFQNLSDAMVDRLVPKAEAAAAVQCWTEQVCSRTMIPMCHQTGFRSLATRRVCSDGTSTWLGSQCANCTL
ncbi:hypothetical protein ABT354_24150 [Streptomyces sp. NPDC000594]|uniref:hypothetical protein n=1 Tax=Streptomyces sp. NPDC000594 TaxID=3154261 RepID=UPI003324E915